MHRLSSLILFIGNETAPSALCINSLAGIILGKKSTACLPDSSQLHNERGWGRIHLDFFMPDFFFKSPLSFPGRTPGDHRCPFLQLLYWERRLGTEQLSPPEPRVPDGHLHDQRGPRSPSISSFPLQNVKPLYSILSDGSCCSILKEEAHQCLSHIK